MDKTQFLPYKESLAMKNLGYDEECFRAFRNTDGEEELMCVSNWTNSGPENTHDGYCAAPLHQQALSWLIDKYKDVKVELKHSSFNSDYSTFMGYDIIITKNGLRKQCSGAGGFEKLNDMLYDCISLFIYIVQNPEKYNL